MDLLSNRSIIVFVLFFSFFFGARSSAQGLPAIHSKIEMPKIVHPKTISIGNAHFCAIDNEGVKCWGEDTHGQSFLIPKLFHPKAVTAGYRITYALDDQGVKCWGLRCEDLVSKIPKLLNPKTISAGQDHVCALDEVGVKCWGNDSQGQISKMPKLSKPKAISAGRWHTCALDLDGVKCWGADSDGQVSKIPNLTKPRAISAGMFHNCALDDTGVKCWGKDFGGGVSRIPKLSNPKAISAGGLHSCALDDSGVKCWGYDHDGQISRMPKLTNPKMVGAGEYNTCAIDDDGVKCWGLDPKVVSDHLRATGIKYPPAIPMPTLSKIKTVSVGVNHFCVIEGSKIKCWGSDNFGQSSKIANTSNPRTVVAGTYHSCALDDTGVVCWGNDEKGMFSNMPKFSNPKMISIGESHTCAIDDTGAKCWGRDYGGVISKMPQLSNPKGISTNRFHTCALDDSGVKCWGMYQGAEAKIPHLINPKAISVGEFHSCAIDDTGVKCWGDDKNGIVSKIPKLSNPKSISSQRDITCALDDFGVSCWGADNGLISNMPKLTNVKSISSGGLNICAIDDSGLVCWGHEIEGHVANVPKICKEPNSETCRSVIREEGRKACALSNPQKCLEYAAAADYKKLKDLAEEFYSRACENKSPEGCLKSGDLHVSERQKPGSYLLYKKSCELGDKAGCLKLNERNVKACEEGELDACYQIGRIEKQNKNLVKAKELFLKACNGGHKPACSFLPQQELLNAKKLKVENYERRRAEQKKIALSPEYLKRISTEFPKDTQIQAVLKEHLNAIDSVYSSLDNDDLWLAGTRDQLESSNCLSFLMGVDEKIRLKATTLIADYKKSKGYEKFQKENMEKYFNPELRDKLSKEQEGKDASASCKVKLEKEFVDNQTKTIKAEEERRNAEPIVLPGTHPFIQKLFDNLHQQARSAKLAPEKTGKYILSMLLTFLLPTLDLQAKVDNSSFEKSCPGISDKFWDNCKKDKKYSGVMTSNLSKMLCLQDNKGKIDKKCFVEIKFDSEKIMKDMSKKSNEQLRPEMLEALAGEVKKDQCEIPPELKNGIISFKEEMLVTYKFSRSFTSSPEFRHLMSRSKHDEWEEDSYGRRERRYQFYTLPAGTKLKVVDCVRKSSFGGGSSDLLVQGDQADDVYLLSLFYIVDMDDTKMDVSTPFYRLFDALEGKNIEKITAIVPLLKQAKLGEIFYKKVATLADLPALQVLFKELPQIDITTVFNHFSNNTYAPEQFAEKRDRLAFCLGQMGGIL